MPRTRLFIGSSSAAKSQAKAFVTKFESPTLEFLPWWDAFTAGRTLLEDLDKIRTKVDAAVLVFSPEAEATVRKKTVQVPNLNALFEFGNFYGQLGKDKVAMVRYGDFYLPSDLGGYIHIFGSNFFKPNAVAAVGKRCEKEFGKWVSTL